ncbi:MAG: sulfite exporter TauE/SafE family protein [Cyclobacteriaceae bacterium]|nr:sulfite exporter TauE/SafE family protein [Cyclobacteriaceae bacterium]MBX2956547.1 sulfite exporter TauE/SafE family protein [Cyclobacteriaceae bacterium]
MIENLLLVLAGLIGGFIAGLTGIGTGFLMVAVIPLVLQRFGVPEQHYVSVTIANAIFATMVSSLSNVVTSLRHRSFYPKETLWTALGAVSFSFAVFELVAKSSFYSRELFNGVVVFFMFIIIIQTFKKLRLSSVGAEHVTRPKLLVTGSLAGSAAALTGLGGGTLIIPMLNLWQRVDILKAKSISFGTIAAIAVWLSINNLFFEPTFNIPNSQGLIVFPMIIPIVIGVVIGSPLGVTLSHKISARAVTILFLIVISLVAIQKIAELVWL